MRRCLRYGLMGLCLVAALAGCGGPVTRAELPGTYVADYGFARETVVLTADGRFTQTVKVSNRAKVAVAKGTWEYDAEAGYIRFSQQFFLVMDGYGQPIRNFEHPKMKGIVVLPVLRGSRGVQISGDPDVPYLRQAAKRPKRP